jgi:hypothetical protein
MTINVEVLSKTVVMFILLILTGHMIYIALRYNYKKTIELNDLKTILIDIYPYVRKEGVLSTDKAAIRALVSSVSTQYGDLLKIRNIVALNVFLCLIIWVKYIDHTENDPLFMLLIAVTVATAIIGYCYREIRSKYDLAIDNNLETLLESSFDLGLIKLIQAKVNSLQESANSINGPSSDINKTSKVLSAIEISINEIRSDNNRNKEEIIDVVRNKNRFK